MTVKTLIAVASVTSILIGCDAGSSLPDSVPVIAASSINGGQEASNTITEQFPVISDQELTPQIFLDGSSLTEDGIRLVEILKSRSNQAFENLNMAYAEGSAPADILSCSRFNEFRVLYGYACQDERATSLLTQYGFPLFVVSPVKDIECSELPIGAFNNFDCEIGSFNFLSETELFGYYRSFREDFEITRESLTITTEDVPAFIEPTLIPNTCVFELLSDGRTLVSDFDNCTDAINNLLNEFTS